MTTIGKSLWHKELSKNSSDIWVGIQKVTDFLNSLYALGFDRRIGKPMGERQGRLPPRSEALECSHHGGGCGLFSAGIQR